MTRREPQRRATSFRSVGILGLAALLVALPVGALTERADLEKWCTQGSAVAVGRCLGYLLAAEDALTSGPVEGIRACLPSTITLQEQHRLLLDWLKAYPEATAQTALALVARAWQARYPCAE